MKNTDSIIWLDLEMTGLDPSKDKIIEIATLATDGLLNIIDIGPVIAINYFKDIIFEMDDWNKDQHAKSGLLDRIKNSKISLYQAEIKTLNFIKKYTYEKKAIIAGNSICQDRQFLIKYMPDLNAYLNYRMIDVSSIKELVKRWYPKKPRFQKKKKHLALDDIKESIKELAYYRDNFFHF